MKEKGTSYQAILLLVFVRDWRRAHNISFITSASELRTIDNQRTTEMNDSYSEDDVPLTDEIQTSSKWFGKLRLAHLAGNAEIQRTIFEFGRCPCARLIIWGVLRRKLSTSTAIEVVNAPEDFPVVHIVQKIYKQTLYEKNAHQIWIKL